MIYELNESENVKRTDDTGVISFIPPDIRNSDYVDFLIWNTKQFEPLVLPEGWPTLE